MRPPTPGRSAVSSGGGADGSNDMMTPACGTSLPSVAPLPHKIEGMSILHTPGPVDEQVAAARAAQPAWASLPLRRRLEPVRRLRHLLADRADDLCAAVAEDVGKSAEETIGGDILPLAAACRFLERRAEGLLRPR